MNTPVLDSPHEHPPYPRTPFPRWGKGGMCPTNSPLHELPSIWSLLEDLTPLLFLMRQSPPLLHAGEGEHWRGTRRSRVMPLSCGKERGRREAAGVRSGAPEATGSE